MGRPVVWRQVSAPFRPRTFQSGPAAGLNCGFPHSDPPSLSLPAPRLRGWPRRQLPRARSAPFPSLSLYQPPPSLVTRRGFILLFIENRRTFSFRVRVKPFQTHSHQQIFFSPTEHVIENEFLHNLNCRLKKHVCF